MRTLKGLLFTIMFGVFTLLAACNGMNSDSNLVENKSVSDERIIINENAQGPRIMEINNVDRGNKLKENLDNRKEVTHFHHNKHNTSHYLDHEVAVHFKQTPTAEELDQMAKEIDGRVLKQDGLLYVFRSFSIETPQILEYFQKKQNVEYAEPQYLLMQNDLRQMNELNMPNDQLYMEQYQWNLPVIETEQGWKITRGSRDVTIAVVDTGVDLDHPDLVNRLVDGYNVLGDNHYPDDDNGHGTHVAGIIASETNNREGTAGISWYSKIMPVKTMGAEGYGTTFDIAKGIIWAVDHGADVINLSLGNYKDSKVLNRAIKYAYKNDVVLVAAAGNDASLQPTYPAAYPEVLAVSAVNFDGRLADFSNYGNYINIAAPGEYIPSTYFHKQYAALSGTSMAAPHVAGLASLIKSANPALSNKKIIDIIKTTAVDLGTPGKDHEFGHGIIDVNEALNMAAADAAS